MQTFNTLLQSLQPAELERVAPHFERVELKRGDVLFESLAPIGHAYFFESGLSSEVATSDGKSIEIGCVGREGFSGAALALGVDRTPHRSFMQAGGEALRIPASVFQAKLEENVAFRHTVLRYVHVFQVQIAATALADGRSTVEQRLARWVLMAQDRLGDELPLTHEFFALMLGVRRPSVTDAIHALESTRCIRAERGLVTVRNRKTLEALAGGSYGVPEAEYDRLIHAP
ncbi:Crp/Fnr family transcriptional regulator [Pseudorhizobium pelagicum]|uniref:HTH crp-type domain-containing protein n=1 Tax=Pseudorhizobium pelagicum TaxID=1509405 RepID=A0A922TA68_9HYPH|nr:Crp/Fnr family transcriptional regulator [Pseudorhizobium pelagicum]KEQ04760.1 hypothetical protein GV68_12275 [Pseudorhizobium pelagicum]